MSQTAPLISRPLFISLGLFALLAGLLYRDISGHAALLLTLGGALGLALYQASFGFTAAWRNLITERRGRGLRAQMLMLAVAVCLIFPILDAGSAFGNDVNGFNRPLGFSVLFGAALFGIGMQIAGGCGSGSLFQAGGGQLRAVPAIIGFMAGGFWATADYEWWTTLPQLAPVSSLQSLGLITALAANLSVFALIALATVWLEKRRHGELQADNAGKGLPLSKRLLRGPWPLIWGAVALALLNYIVVIVTGRPWSVALSYPLWGTKLALWLDTALQLGYELEPDFWTYWLQPGRDDALLESIWEDTVSVMNIGILLGAFLAASLAGRFSWQWRIPPLHWLASALGGLMLGYGATISFGCNIGAFFGGIVSGSMHGWLWLAGAIIGSYLGIWIRPLFRLSRM